MRKKLIILALMTTGLYSYGQSSKSTPAKVKTESELVDSTATKRHIVLTFDPESYPERKFKYTDSTGNHVVIQNIGPRGGGEVDGIRGYYDSSGTHYGYGFFVARVTNETTAPLDLSINFPAELFAISKAPGAFFKLYLPPDTMTIEKLSLYNYGISGLTSFLDTNFNKPTVLHRTVNPHEEFLFLIGLLVHVPQQDGPIRMGFVLKEQELFYRIYIAPLGSALIPCGQFLLKNNR